MQVEVPDVGVVDFPDDATDQEIQDLLNETYPAPQASPNTGEILRAEQPTLPPPVSSTGIPEIPGSITPVADWAQRQREESFVPSMKDIQLEAPGLPSLMGITPESVPSGRRIAESPLGRAGFGLAGLIAPEFPATVASSVGKTAIGVGEYLSSPQGIVELVGSMTPAKLAVLAKWAYDMSKGAYTEASEFGKLLAKENKTPEDRQKLSDHAVNALAMGLGAGGVIKHGAKDIKKLAQDLNMPEGKIPTENRGEVLQQMFNEYEARRQAEAGSPFTLLEPPTSPVSMGVRTQPTLGTPPTFEPSGLGRPEVNQMRPIPPGLGEEITAPSVETVRAQRELEQRQAEAESAKTAISRGERVSEPTEWLVSRNAIGGLLFRTNQRILHHGRGKAVADTEALKKLPNVSEVVEHDPKYVPNPQALGKQDFDQVVSNYVLNTLPPAARRSAIIDIGSSMKPSIPGVDYAKKGGVAWITVRGGGDVIKGVAREDGVVTSKGTWQRNYTPEQIMAELKPYFKHVKIVKGNTKSSKSTTVIVQDYIGPEKKGGDPNAIQQKAEGAVRDVRQPEIPQEGAGQVPAREGSAKAAEALKEGQELRLTIPEAQDFQYYRNQGFTPEQALEMSLAISGRTTTPAQPKMLEGKIDSGTPKTPEARVEHTLESDKALYKDISDRMLKLVKEGQGFSPLMEVLKAELEVVKNRHEGMPPGQKSPARKTMQAQQEAMKAAAVNELAPAVRIGGRVVSDPNKGHIQMALEIGGPDALADVSNPANQGFVYKGEFISREAASSLIGEKTPLTSERLREIRSQQKGGEPVEKAKEEKPVLEPEVEGVTALDPQSGTPLSATESLINRLEALKFPEQGPGPKLYTLDPKIIQRVGKQLWNDAIITAQFAIRAGKTIAEAIDAAIAHIRKTRSGIDEAPMRAELQKILGPETPAEIPAATMFPVEGENVQMRKSAERATTAPSVPEPVQQRIATAEESFYRQQSMAKVEDVVSTMSDADLVSVPRDSNLYTAAKLEQANRLFKAGKNDEGYKVFVELEKEGTRLGQLINQFKLLKSTRPEEVVRVINKALEKSGKDPLPKPAEESAIKTASKSKEADRKLENATDEWARNPTPENAAKAEKSLLDANDAALELQRFISKYQPRSTSSIIKSVLQGNLLTPISEVANIVGNMAFLPFRAATRGVATAMDVLNNYLRKTPRQITVQPVRGAVEAVKGFGRGAKQIPDVFLRGTGDVIKGETRAGLHPIKAWINQFSKNPEMPTTGGRLTLKDRINLAIEGTFGVPAEAMLRGLGAGDVAFKEAAKARATATELSLANVPKDQWSFAQKFPELFLTPEAMQRIQTDTLQAVFQRPSKTLSLVTNWLRGKGEFIDLLAATVAPYKLTPWNIIGEILSYNPLIAAARSVNSSRLKNPREARLNAGKFVVGSMVTAAGWWLYKNGLMSPSLDQRDEAQKARVLAGEVMPPNHINLSGLKRKLEGGDPTYKPGDETIDVFRAGGLAGSMFYMTANIGRDFERMPEVANSEVWGAILRQSTLEQARFGMNQSFLSGVEGLLSAVREGNTDNYIRQWGNTVASIPLPNTLTVMSRASREYKPDFREETFRKQMENIVRNKLGVANLDDYLPLKRGLWGEPMRETPEGRNAILYHFFDVFKNKQVTTDPVPLELFRLWRKTGDTQVIPSLPEKFLTIGGNSYALDSAQQSRYAELVGKARRRIVDAVVVNPNFHNLPDEAKIKLLDRIYRAGLDQGKGQFWQEVGGMLQPKPERAGFRPASDTPQ